MPTLKALLMRREGYETKVYKDSLGRLTVGIGHLVTRTDNLKLGDEVDAKRIDGFFKDDSSTALAAAKLQAGKAKIKDPGFVIYLASVNYQLGTQWFRKFKKTWKLILDGKYADAAQEAMKSRWAKQTPKRAKDFQQALLNLTEPAP